MSKRRDFVLKIQIPRLDGGVIYADFPFKGIDEELAIELYGWFATTGVKVELISEAEYTVRTNR